MAQNSLDNFTGRLGDVSSAADQVQNKSTDVVNRVQDTVSSAQRGVESVTSLYDNTIGKAGETWNASGSSASGLLSKVGNLFGGSDLASNNAVQAAGSGDSGVSPANRIAGFANDPTGTLPSLDPLKRDVSEPFKASNEAAAGVMDYLQPDGGGSLLSQGFQKLKDIQDGVLNVVGTDYDSVKKRLESTMQLAGQIARLPSEIQQEVYNYTTAIGNIKSEVTSTIDGVTHTFDSIKDLDDYLAIDNLISSFTGTSNDIRSLDIGTSAALIYGVSGKLSEYGLAEKTDALVDAITDPVAKAALYGELLVQAAGIGKLESIEYYITKLIAGQGRELAPEVIPLVLQNLQTNEGEGFKALGLRVIALLNSLNPIWDKTTKLPTRTELLPYTYCNSNAIQALVTTSKRPYVCAAGNRRLVSAGTLVDQFFPV